MIWRLYRWAEVNDYWLFAKLGTLAVFLSTFLLGVLAYKAAWWAGAIIFLGLPLIAFATEYYQTDSVRRFLNSPHAGSADYLGRFVATYIFIAIMFIPTEMWFGLRHLLGPVGFFQNFIWLITGGLVLGLIQIFFFFAFGKVINKVWTTDGPHGS